MRRYARHLLKFEPFIRCQLPRNQGYIRGFIALAPMRHWGKIRRVGLDHQPVGGNARHQRQQMTPAALAAWGFDARKARTLTDPTDPFGDRELDLVRGVKA